MLWLLIGLSLALLVLWLVTLTVAVRDAFVRGYLYRESSGVLIPPPSEESQKVVKLRFTLDESREPEPKPVMRRSKWLVPGR